MKSKSLLKNKLKMFYEGVDIERIQTDQYSNQNETKQVNREYEVKIFSARINGGQSIVAEQKIRKSRKLILKLKRIYKGKKVNPKLLTKHEPYCYGKIRYTAGFSTKEQFTE